MPYTGYGMPRVDFSPLGEIPNDIAQARIREARTSLADLASSNDPDTLMQGARRLLAAGDIQGGISLYGLAQKQQELQLGLEGVRQVGAAFPVGGSQQTPVAPAAPTATIEPRGIRNNNPLNIEAGGFAQSQSGFMGSDGRFARFASPDQGISAAENLINTYRDKYGLNTVAGIVGRWAPASENGASTNNYVASVANQLGVDPNQPIDTNNPNVRRSLVMAMGQFENGKPVQLAQATPAAPSTSPPQAPGAGVVGLDEQQQQRINNLTRMLANPYLPKSTADALKARLEGELKAAEPTTERKNYELYAAQERAAGRVPISFNDFAQQGKETAQEKKLGESFAANYTENIAAGKKATQLLGSLNLMDKAMKQPDFYSGPGEGTVLMIKRGIATLGGNPNAAQPMEEFRNLSNKSVYDTLGSLGNQISNSDRSFIIDTFPNLSNTPQGNAINIEIQRRLAQRAQEVAKQSTEYLRKNKTLGVGFDEAMQKYATDNPLFSDKEIADIQAKVGVQTPQPAAPSAIPETIRGRSVQEQLNAAPLNSVARINGQRMIKQSSDRWVPYNGR